MKVQIWKEAIYETKEYFEKGSCFVVYSPDALFFRIYRNKNEQNIWKSD